MPDNPQPLQPIPQSTPEPLPQSFSQQIAQPVVQLPVDDVKILRSIKRRYAEYARSKKWRTVEHMEVGSLVVDLFVKPKGLLSFGSGFIFADVADKSVMHRARSLSKAVGLVYVVCATATRDVLDDETPDIMVYCASEGVKLFVRSNAYEFETFLMEVMDILFEKYKRGNYEYLMLARKLGLGQITEQVDKRE